LEKYFNYFYLNGKEFLQAPEVESNSPAGSPTSGRVLKNISHGMEVLPVPEFGKLSHREGSPTSARVWKEIYRGRKSYQGQRLEKYPTCRKSYKRQSFEKYLTWKGNPTSARIDKVSHREGIPTSTRAWKSISP
jgi:hypothetical protein